MRKLSPLIVCVGVVFSSVLLLPGEADALLYKYRPLSWMVSNSSALLEVRVDDVDIYAGVEDPETLVTLTVTDVLGGDVFVHDEEFWFRLPSGAVPGSADFTSYAGAPTFLPGETYIVFLTRHDWRITPIIQGQHGIFRRVYDSTSEDYYLVNQNGHCLVEVGEDDIRLSREAIIQAEPMVVTADGSGNPRQMRLSHGDHPATQDFSPCARMTNITQALADFVQAEGGIPSEATFARTPVMNLNVADDVSDISETPAPQCLIYESEPICDSPAE